jgi:hypothetical protein
LERGHVEVGQIPFKFEFQREITVLVRAVDGFKVALRRGLVFCQGGADMNRGSGTRVYQVCVGNDDAVIGSRVA